MALKRSLIVAILQSSGQLQGPDARFDSLCAHARRLKACKLKGQSVDLLVCPESFASGYKIGNRIKDFAEPANGTFASRVQALAKEVGFAILYGYPEREENTLHNSAICISSNGDTVAEHRKSVLPPGFEQDFYSAGTALTLFTLSSVKLAILICYEAELPEGVRNVAKSGAEVVIVPTALIKKWQQIPHRVIPTRAFENGVFMVYANHAGIENDAEYAGLSCIVSPDGSDLVRAGDQEEILLAQLNIDDVNAARQRIPYLKDGALIPND